MIILSTVTNQDLMRQIEKLSSSQNHNLVSIILPPIIVGIVSILSVLISNHFSTKNTQKQLDAQQKMLEKQLTSQQNQMLITMNSNEAMAREQYEKQEQLQNHKFMNEYSFNKLVELSEAVQNYYNEQIDEDLKVALAVNLMRLTKKEQKRDINNKEFQSLLLKLKERKQLLWQMDLFCDFKCRHLTNFGSPKIKELFNDLSEYILKHLQSKAKLMEKIIYESDYDFSNVNEEIQIIRKESAKKLKVLYDQIDTESQNIIQNMKQ
ncbi:hypothetical protein [Leuconostoc mesenteroides]|uniref:hypothetical protein n=1 Tax=Leuconostoc mesenteroides TaxID=1245 RepID=UPI002115B2AC|nr:hypothetical protein [Leuconostoc mesenteroides]UUE18574.1 hypothetical protein LQZ13_03865 [Leuconostoc mesenteroides]